MLGLHTFHFLFEIKYFMCVGCYMSKTLLMAYRFTKRVKGEYNQFDPGGQSQ